MCGNWKSYEWGTDHKGPWPCLHQHQVGTRLVSLNSYDLRRPLEKCLIFMSKIFLNKMNSSHIPLLFLLVSDSILWKIWRGCKSTRAVSAQWRLSQQLNVICVHTCPSVTLALKQNHLAVLAVHYARFHRSWPKRPSHTFKRKIPQDFYSKTISFLCEWQVCSYSIPPNKWEPYDHKARESVASLHCSPSTIHPSNLCMGKASSVNVRPVHSLG